jgi:hypothetical protein
MPSAGRIPRQAPTSGDEWEKRITASLMEGPPVILIDNIPPPPHPGLDSPAFATVLTAGGLWEGRVLGSSQMVRLPVRNVWVATGNNIDVSTENSRRVCRIHLDREVEDPTRGVNFRIPNLSHWVQTHRAKIVWSALTVIQAWLNAEHPEGYDSHADLFRPLAGTQMKQSYIEWSRVMGGLLRFIGQKGFLEQDDLMDMHEREELDLFFTAWSEQIGELPLTNDEIASQIGLVGSAMRQNLPSELLGVRPEQMTKVFRYWLRSNRNRVAGGRKLVRIDGRHKKWVVRAI